jgi:transcription termination/antitermination protein NusG
MTLDAEDWSRDIPHNDTKRLASCWYVLYTRSNCEQLVCDQLMKKGFSLFLPKIRRAHRHGEMQRVADAPLFPGYVFLNHTMDKVSYVELRKARGMVSVLGERWDCLATVPNKEIEAIQSALRANVPLWPHAYLREGTKVRLLHGPLTGVEGVLVQVKAKKGLLVLSVDLLQRSVAIEVDYTCVAAV